MSLEIKIKKKVSKIFDLEVDFQTSRSCLGILGASGCGKSITLKCIAGIDTPDEGRIVLNDRVLFDSKKKINIKVQERNVGYLFQNYALFPRMSVEQNIGIGLSRMSKEKRKEKVDRLMTVFQLEGLGKRCPDQLSGGQQQRAALARMLACDPELILLDEPFSALDTYLREQMQLQLLEIIKEHKDVIMVSHSRDEVYRLCGDMMVMNNGRSMEMGNTKKLFDKPGLAFTALMTGCKNISPIQITGEKEIFAVDWGVTLKTDAALTEDCRYVGIRAHDFQAVSEPQTDADNLIRVNILSKTEDPFEFNIIFCNGDTAETGMQKRIWWKVSKYMFHEIPPYLRFPPESLLILKESAGIS